MGLAAAAEVVGLVLVVATAVVAELVVAIAAAEVVGLVLVVATAVVAELVVAIAAEEEEAWWGHLATFSFSDKSKAPQGWKT